MSAHPAPSDTAFRLADPDAVRSAVGGLRRTDPSLRGPLERAPYRDGPRADRSRGVRGPSVPFRDDKTGVGFQASTDPSDEGLRAATADAEGLTRFSEFPAKRVELPATASPSTASVEIRDSRLWERPAESLGDTSTPCSEPSTANAASSRASVRCGPRFRSRPSRTPSGCGPPTRIRRSTSGRRKSVRGPRRPGPGRVLGQRQHPQARAVAAARPGRAVVRLRAGRPAGESAPHW